ncbi:MAG: hemK [Nocardioides sp.]|jgi:release factor glutamine methyltransferase|nr:hemK [Nocardioides sp.]
MPPQAIVARLRAAGCVFAEDEARVIREVAGSPDELERLVAAREAGTPLELVVGFAEFCGLRVAVAPGVFVPRRRTTFLVERAVALLRPGAVAVDLCCGTGAIGAALAARVDGLEVWAADVDPDAVRCARRNLPPGRVLEGDLYDALPGHLRGRVDVLAVNAPYVPTDAIALMPPEARDHEHRVALDGGTTGLDVQARVAEGAPEWLRPGGTLLVETSARQAPDTADLMTRAGLVAQIASDVEIGGTVVLGVLPTGTD